MRWTLAALALAAGIPAAGAQSPAGFSPLFHGTLAGATIENGGTFRVEHGVLRAEGPNGWLRFHEPARDFRLLVELRFVSDNGDSGIFLRAKPDGPFARGWPNRSYQIQLLNPVGAGALPPVGGLLRHGMPPGDTALDREAVAKAFTGTGQWQRIEIDMIGTEVTVRLNGAVVTRARGLADVEGFIGVQSETSAVEFRRIDIQRLARK